MKQVLFEESPTVKSLSAASSTGNNFSVKGREIKST